jgi:hypothetical protein
LSRSLAADPEFCLAHCLKGYFAMLLYKQAGVAPAVQSARTARPLVAKATAREQSHVEALDAWAAGDLDRTLAIWEAILADYPTDTLALRLLDPADLWATHSYRIPRGQSSGRTRSRPSWANRDPIAERLARPIQACGCPHHGDAGSARRRHCLARRAGATLGRRQ